METHHGGLLSLRAQFEKADVESPRRVDRCVFLGWPNRCIWFCSFLVMD